MQNENKEVLLQPWQAFVQYGLNGSKDVLRIYCPEDFRVTDMAQTPKSSYGFSQQDPHQAETGLQDMNGINTVEFACDKRPVTEIFCFGR